MKWQINKPKEDRLRFRDVFAWLPTKVGKYRVWLEFYTKVEQYTDGKWLERDRF